MQEIPKAYDPKQCERKWYGFWSERGHFAADPASPKPKYCITIPPPNVTGDLHLGHALQHAIHDALIRWKRMDGFETLCLPGMDHAGIATQMKVERELGSEGLDRRQLGREAFLERMWQWKERHGGNILRQFRELGCSYDWARERFTLDEHYHHAVLSVFVHFYQRGWVYRGKRVINWCPEQRTAISDLEVEHMTVRTSWWYIAYPMVDGSGEIVVATTRPETMLGDTAVAVHPDDPCYADVVGREVVLPIMNRRIPIITDEYVDPESGTGALKVTPAHDPYDFEIGQRHRLDAPVVIGLDGRMTEEAGEFAGMDRFEARDGVVAKLRALDLLRKIEDYEHSVGHCMRCGAMIEPLLSEQWFVKMDDLAQAALKHIPDPDSGDTIEDAHRQGKVAYLPDRFARTTRRWLEEIRDWCISRQLWWGHRIPIYYCDACGETTAYASEHGEKPTCKCGSPDVRQDEDVLDTWFSSALWPFVVLGWPGEKTPLLDAFYPQDVMITARDILYLWIARMIMCSEEFLGKIPFKDVFIHGTILDEQGRIMSRSKGTGYDPLELTGKYGTDATRFGLLLLAGMGQDIRFNVEKFEMGRNFANKMWNASRFILMSPGEPKPLASIDRGALRTPDRWILSRLQETIAGVRAALGDYRFADAAMAIYQYLWDEYCDWYVELSKPRLVGDDTADADTAKTVLVHVLESVLRLLHPFMPFVTEELWQAVTSGRIAESPDAGDRGIASIMVAPFPAADESRLDEDACATMRLLIDIVRAIRNKRAELEAPPGERIAAAALIGCTERAALDPELAGITFTARADVELVDPDSDRGRRLSGQRFVTARVGDRCLLVFPEADVDKEVDRLRKEIDTIDKEIYRAEGKLSNPKFVEKAPGDLVEQEKQKLETWTARRRDVKSRLESLIDA
jgi:valyl-tRNA synthetase